MGTATRRVRREGDLFPVVVDRRPACDLLIATPGSGLVENAAGWLQDHAAAQYEADLRVQQAEAIPGQGRHVVALVGRECKAVRSLRARGLFEPDAGVGPQGFVVERVADGQADLLLCWAAEPLGCRYGLIEILRSLDDRPDGCGVKLSRCVDWPQFPVRILYLNFAELLVNGYGPNIIHDSAVYRWTMDEWRRYIDMLSAMRFNVFAFWLTPRLVGPESLEGGGIYDRFTEEMNAIIDYAHTRGLRVEMLIIVNNLGPNWDLHCPRAPAEKETMLKVWDHWTQRIRADIVALFPGDPGGCTRNGCDAEDGIDLYLDIVNRVKDNGMAEFELCTWGTPIWGWGEHGWKGDRQRAERAIAYLIKRLPDFPANCFVSINMGLNPGAVGHALGGDTREWVEAISQTRQVTTWDYCITEGEGAPHPHYRVPAILDRRRLEATRPYSGGITYTMCPKITQVQMFASAEAFWNVDQTPAAVEKRLARFVFGSENESLAGIFPLFELMGSWGGGCQRGRELLIQQMTDAIGLIDSAKLSSAPRLPFFPAPGEHLDSYRYFADLFLTLARTHVAVQEAERVTRALGDWGHKPLSIVEAKTALKSAAAGHERHRLAELVAQIEEADLQGRWQAHWDKLCKIYDSTPRPKSYLAAKWMRDTFEPFGYSFAAGAAKARP